MYVHIAHFEAVDELIDLYFNGSDSGKNGSQAERV